MSKLYRLTKAELRKNLSELRKEIKQIEAEFIRRERKEPEFYQTRLVFSDKKERPVYTLVDMENAPYGEYFPAALSKKALIKNPDGPAKLVKYRERYSSEGGSDYDYGHTYHSTRTSYRFRWNREFLGYDDNGKKL